MTPEQRKDMINRIRRLPARLDAEVTGLNDSQLDTPYRDGGWTVRQVVHHLVDSHMNSVIRMKLILTEDHPTLRPYDQEKWAELPDTKQLPIEGSLQELKRLHERWCYLLDHITDQQWQRAGYHPENGDMVLEDFLKIYSHHGENHLKQITILKEKMGW
jgi:DinB superfamily